MIKKMLQKTIWILFALLSGYLPQVQADVQPRPALSGYMVRSLIHGPAETTVLHATPEAAANDFCASRNKISSVYTGAARFYNAVANGPPSYKASCLNQPAGGGAPYWDSPVQWDLPFTYLCNPVGSIYNDIKKTCHNATDRGPQKSSCAANDSGLQPGLSEVGNPIDISTGQKLLREQDYAPVNGLGFTRLYSSANLAANTFSPHWRHNYSRSVISTRHAESRMQFAPDKWVLNPQTRRWQGVTSRIDPEVGSNGRNTIGLSLPDPNQPLPAQGDSLYLIRDDGNHLFFRSTDQGLTWQGDSGVNYQVRGVSTGGADISQWQVTTPETDIETYDAATGHLLSIQFRDGRKQTLHYSTALTAPDFAQKSGLLLEVRDNFGRSLKFRYRNNLLAKMIDPAGQEFVYQYDDQQRLISVTWPDGLQRLYHYDESAYSGVTAGNGYLTGISDEIASGNVVRMATYQYDQNGIPYATEHGNGVNRYVSDMVNHRVTDPLGTMRQYSFIEKDGMQLLSGISKPGGAGCAASSSSMAYDNELNLISQTDFNGTVTRFSYYPHNLLKTRTDAFGTPQQRMTSWEWHPVFRVPSRIAAPKLLTTYEYDLNGNLLSTTEQATLDETGAQGVNPTPVGPARTTSYRYNGVGQITSQTEWRDNLALTTLYQYHPENGNLEKVTDPVGLTTHYTDYNAHGDVTRTLQPNGNLARLEYHPRRWLARRTEIRQDNSSETTAWEYDGRGLLTKLTRPNGSYHVYNYDDAGRLVNIADNFDNSLDYTLDPMGNRLLEQVRDPAGRLLGQVRRSYDALNRLQQVTVGKNEAVQDTPTNIVIESLAPLARPGYPVKIRATVEGVAPSGEVVLMEGERTLGIQFLQRGSTTFTVPDLPIGPHTLTAFYSGDDKNRPSRASTIIQTIQPGIASQIELTCPANSMVDATLTCQVRVRTDAAWANRLQGQTVRLFEGNIERASATLAGISTDLVTYQAQFSLRGLAVGQHALQVRYTGDAILLPGESVAVAHTVLDHAPQISEITFGGNLVAGMQYNVTINRSGARNAGPITRAGKFVPLTRVPPVHQASHPNGI